jgi:hypothetical protein
MRALATLLLATSAALAACAGDVSTSADDDSATPGPDGAPGDVPDGAPTAAPDAAVDPDSLAAACAPVITYENTTTSGDDARFEAHVPDKQAYFAARSLEVCKVLYRIGAEVPPRPTLKFVLEDGDGVAYTLCGGNSCDEMHLNAGYVAQIGGDTAAVDAEIDGVIVHELGHVFQHMGGEPPGWLIEGEADFIRYRAGYIPLSNRQAGGHYDDAYQTTAFFLDYVDRTYPDAGYELNQSKNPALGTSWSEDVFVTLTGKSVQALWDDYQGSL